MSDSKIPVGGGPRVTALGGGTGLSTMLRGLKYYTNNLTAIVTVADDGLGFDPAAPAPEESIGLNNVRRRLSRFPGCGIEIFSAPGRGTRVVLSYPKTSVKKLANSIQLSQ